MSDPFYPFSGGFPGGDGAPPPRYSDFELELIAARYGAAPPPYRSSTDVGAFDAHVGARRPAEVLCHQTFMGSHSMFGQNEALYSSNTMAKRPRLESSHPIYPQRPGAQECAFYMTTRTCKYGETCKFDHPQWVLEGGVQSQKEVPDAEDSYPERPGEPDCPYFIKTSKCRFKSKCKFNHPKEKVNASLASADNESLISDSSTLPVRPSEPLCTFYAKTGKCKFGANCKFNHPKDIKILPLAGKQTIYTATFDAADGSPPAGTKALAPPAEAFNSKGYPIRPGEVDCAFYMKTGSCMYASTCRFNHPEHRVVDVALPAVPEVVLNPVSSFLQRFDFPPAEILPVIYPQRPGQTVCDFYMKTGYCKYSEKCKFHHPVDRSAPDPSDPENSVVELTPAGFPRRRDATICAFYMKTGTCKFGVRCKFDHPPPEEVAAKLQAEAAEEEGGGAAARSSPMP